MSNFILNNMARPLTQEQREKRTKGFRDIGKSKDIIRTLIQSNWTETTRAVYSSKRIDGFLVLLVIGLPVLYKSLRTDTIDKICIPEESDIKNALDKFNELNHAPLTQYSTWVRYEMDTLGFLKRMRMVWREAHISAKRKGKWTIFTSETILNPVYMEFGDTYIFPENYKTTVPFLRSGGEVPLDDFTRMLTFNEYHSPEGVLTKILEERQTLRTMHEPVRMPKESPEPKDLKDRHRNSFNSFWEDISSTVTIDASMISSFPTGLGIGVGTGTRSTGAGAFTGARTITGTWGVHDVGLWNQEFIRNTTRDTPRLADAVREESEQAARRELQNSFSQALGRVLRTSRIPETLLHTGVEALTTPTQENTAQGNTRQPSRPFYRRERY